MQEVFKQVTKLNKELSNYRPLNETELKVIRENFVYEASYNSNAIEGNSLTLKETVLLLKDGITVGKKPIRDYLDMIGFRDAFDYIYDLSKKNTEISEIEIKNIHSLVLNGDKENKGIYRRVPVRISGSDYIPPQPYEIQPKVEELLINYKEWKQTKHIIEAISLFHLKFESIHPFIDGNGRTGRLLLNLELIKNGLLPIDIKFIDRDNYYNAFNSYSENDKDYKDMAIMIAEYEIQELENRLSILKSRI